VGKLVKRGNIFKKIFRFRRARKRRLKSRQYENWVKGKSVVVRTDKKRKVTEETKKMFKILDDLNKNPAKLRYKGVDAALYVEPDRLEFSESGLPRIETTIVIFKDAKDERKRGVNAFLAIYGGQHLAKKSVVVGEYIGDDLLKIRPKKKLRSEVVKALKWVRRYARNDVEKAKIDKAIEKLKGW